METDHASDRKGTGFFPLHEDREETAGAIRSARRLTGVPVRNTRGEPLGHLDDVLVDVERKVLAYAVVADGGILGLGTHLYIVPWKALRLHSDRETTLLLDVRTGGLREAPRLDIENFLDWTYGARIHQYYGVTPYWEEDASAIPLAGVQEKVRGSAEPH
jgi:sporulation protein YlmC with PRC-barrel domain